MVYDERNSLGPCDEHPDRPATIFARGAYCCDECFAKQDKRTFEQAATDARKSLDEIKRLLDL